ncbi:hypothetical protein Ae706Ps2_6423c [Pseudonocardia sp. Ae706_Ps2]|nr:hypothetical protein Ae706Ps2_6417c [Pseudonocardia sp. Ae706_Ps2]OLM09399.1 hypothetical protein Ae706Ps2_6420c [Pseudonocardia sp. Ae706_Ps2]OLM09402.1 hypothetical protein Ae706Ps2_6423c [Pseudonocardia sp. Ae706_Ps2]
MTPAAGWSRRHRAHGCVGGTGLGYVEIVLVHQPHAARAVTASSVNARGARVRVGHRWPVWSRCGRFCPFCMVVLWVVTIGTGVFPISLTPV